MHLGHEAAGDAAGGEAGPAHGAEGDGGGRRSQRAEGEASPTAGVLALSEGDVAVALVDDDRPVCELGRLGQRAQRFRGRVDIVEASQDDLILGVP